MTIRLADPRVTERQQQLVSEVLATGRLTYGYLSKRFEREWATVHGWREAVFVNSGTNALKLALLALREQRGWPAGGEVLLPAVTFVASWNAVRMARLEPVLVDVDETLNLDPSLLERAVTERTVALMPVHLLGRPAAMAEITGFAAAAGLAVVEDSCECCFVDTGPKGDLAAYSTYAAHHLSTGVGGLLCTGDPELALLARSLSFHGRDERYLWAGADCDPRLRYRFPREGCSDRIGELEAALGLGGLEEWSPLLLRRQENASHLAERLGTEWVPGHAYMMFPLLHPRRDDLVTHLEANGVETRELMPLTTQPFLDGQVDPSMFPVAATVNRNGLLLPCHPHLTGAEIERVAELVLTL